VTLTDTHSHIYLEEFDNDRAEMLLRANDAGVTTILMPNIDRSTVELMHRVEAQFPNCHAMMGVHPTSVKDDFEDELAAVEKHLHQRPYIAVGEIGIDLYWDKTHLREQIIAFERQIEWAKELQLPIVVHCRDAFAEVFEVLDRLNDASLRGVFHSFSGGGDEIKHVARYGGFKVGINGIVTFKKAALPEVVAAVNPSLLVVETDAPFLAPHPHRGRRNEPSYVPLIVSKLSEVYNLPYDTMVEILGQNSQEVFKF
jgi:TatD DNase family protein